MYSVTVILLVGAVVATLIQPSNGSKYFLDDKPGCTAEKKFKVEKDVARLSSIGKYGRNFPENYAQLKQYCNETTYLKNKVESFFKNCYTREVRDLANLLLFSIKNAVRQFCKKRTKKLQKLISITPCINKHVRSNDQCLVDYINNVKSLVNLPNDKMKIPRACCEYVKSMVCAEELLDRYKCTRDNKELIMDFVRGILSSMSDIVCGEYNETTDKCSRLFKPRNLAPSNTTYISFAFVLIDIFESIK